MRCPTCGEIIGYFSAEIHARYHPECAEALRLARRGAPPPPRGDNAYLDPGGHKGTHQTARSRVRSQALQRPSHSNWAATQERNRRETGE